jgi:fucose permease
MSSLKIKFSLFLNYFVFAILLNSVGIVILKSQLNFGVDEVQASTLELFKDMPIAIVSFLIASFLPKIGFKMSMLFGLAIVTVACLGMYYFNSFLMAKMLFALVGISFALIKVSVFSMVGILTNSSKEHNFLMSSIEGVFMIGIALAYFIFPFFNSEANPNSWLTVYLILSVLCICSFVILFFAKFDEPKHNDSSSIKEDMSQMFGLLSKMLVIIFLVSAFMYLMVEQGIMTWLPTFNQKILKLPENISIMMSSILAISLAAGRLLAGYVTKHVSWVYVLIVCIVCAMVLVVFLLPQTLNLKVNEIKNLSDISLIGYAFPMIGLFLAPIYPLLNSVILSALPKNMHSPMTGLIVIFSALGGTIGSRVVGYLFKYFGGADAFYFTLIPMLVLIICLFYLNKLTKDSLK